MINIMDMLRNKAMILLKDCIVPVSLPIPEPLDSNKVLEINLIFPHLNCRVKINFCDVELNSIVEFVWSGSEFSRMSTRMSGSWGEDNSVLDNFCDAYSVKFSLLLNGSYFLMIVNEYVYDSRYCQNQTLQIDYFEISSEEELGIRSIIWKENSTPLQGSISQSVCQSISQSVNTESHFPRFEQKHASIGSRGSMSSVGDWTNDDVFLPSSPLIMPSAFFPDQIRHCRPIQLCETPLERKIPGRIYHGKMVYIRAEPKFNAQRFIIQLRCTKESNSDILLCLDARFYPNNILARNSMIGGVWKNEESFGRGFPFTPEQEFDLTIQLEDYRFLVAINGQHYAEYSHSMTTRNVMDTLSVMGDLQKLAISFS